MLRAMIEKDMAKKMTQSSPHTPVRTRSNQQFHPTTPERVDSPRTVYFDQEDPFLCELQLDKPPCKTGGLMTFLHCKNCTGGYYGVFTPESSGEFCSKDCQSCYSFMTGKQL